MGLPPYGLQWIFPPDIGLLLYQLHPLLVRLVVSLQINLLEHVPDVLVVLMVVPEDRAQMMLGLAVLKPEHDIHARCVLEVMQVCS